MSPTITSSSFWPPEAALEDSPSSLPVREITSGLSRLAFCVVGGFFLAAAAVDGASYSSTCIVKLNVNIYLLFIKV